MKGLIMKLTKEERKELEKRIEELEREIAIADEFSLSAGNFRTNY